MEQWFEAYPLAERDRLRNHIVTDFNAGFFELFLHAYFKAAGFSVTVHPPVPNASTKPDFLVVGRDLSFYAEATIARDMSDEEVARQNVENHLYEAINATNSPNFFLALREFRIAQGGQPAARRLKAFLERELKNYDPDRIRAEFGERIFDEGPVLTFQDEVLTVAITLVPKSPELRGRPGVRPIGIYPMRSRAGSAATSIRQSIAGKATHYGALDRPYVVCVNSVGEWGWDQDDPVDALFGTEQVTVSATDRNPRITRARDGAFMGPQGPWNTRVSAVLIGAVFPWNLLTCPLELYHNPWGVEPLASGVLPLREASLVDQGLVWKERTALQILFGLPDGWPDQSGA